MALRQIRVEGDPVLNKVSKEVKEVTPRTLELIGDMLDTMYEANGVGLAAVQVGILKRIVVIDVTGEDPVIMINPKIITKNKPFMTTEGCLSLAGEPKETRRYFEIEVEYLDREFKPQKQKYSGWSAQIIQHEIDHCNGVLI